jgi:GNAT superfamily N-acetyltransferase
MTLPSMLRSGVSSVTIDRLGQDVRDHDVHQLAILLLDAIDSGAGVSFMPGLTLAQAEDWWCSLLHSSSDRAIVLVARDADGIVGTVQLQPSWAPNQPHRADVAKLMVHRRGRHQGIARALMETLERSAATAGYTLLLLDTCEGSAAERLYTAMGWVRVGVVPGFALNPDHSLCDTVFFYKQLSR